MNEKTFKDILLLCKGWYGDEYSTIYDAFSAYYKEYYGDYPIDKQFVLYHFIIPCVKIAVRKEPILVDYIFEPLLGESLHDNETDILFDRCTTLLCMSTGDIMGLPSVSELEAVISNTKRRKND